jgi:hypothetical protein
LSESIHAVLVYLDKVDPPAAVEARHRYGCPTPWQDEPTHYGRAVVHGGRPGCEDRAVAQLRELLSRRLDYLGQDGESWFDAVQNARIPEAIETGAELLRFLGRRKRLGISTQCIDQFIGGLVVRFVKRGVGHYVLLRLLNDPESTEPGFPSASGA